MLWLLSGQLTLSGHASPGASTSCACGLGWEDLLGWTHALSRWLPVWLPIRSLLCSDPPNDTWVFPAISRFVLTAGGCSPSWGLGQRFLPFRCLEQNLGFDFWQREMHRVQRDSIFRPERGVCVFWSSIPMRIGVYHRCCGHILILLMPCPVLTTCGLPGEFCAGRVALSCVSPFLSCRLKLFC